MKPEAPTFEFLLQQERLRQHLSTAPAAVAGTVALALALAVLLHGSVPTGIAWAWAASLAAALALRLLVARGQARQFRGLRPVTWLWLHRAAYAVHGLVWMGTALAVADGGQPLPMPLMVFAFTALTAGGLIFAAFDWVAGLAFGAATAAPLVLTLFDHEGRSDSTAVSVALIFVAVLLVTLRRMELGLRHAVRQRQELSVAADVASRAAADAEAARRELADQHRLMTRLLATTNQGCWFVDREGRTTELNDAMCRILGRPREAVLGRPCLDFFEGEDLARMQRELAQRPLGHSGTYEISLMRPDGSRRHCQNNATPLLNAEGQHQGSVGFWADITDVVERGQVLRAAEAAQRALLEAFPGYIAQMDQNLVYRYVNSRLSTLLGLQPAEMVGRTPLELFGPERAALISDECGRTLAGEHVVVDRRMAGLAGGADVHVQITTAMGQAPDSGAAVFYAFGIDVSNLERARVAMAEARAEAERANDAKSQFLAQMSHELRTPMNAILGFAQLLESDRRSTLDARQLLWVGQIRKGGEHLLGLINEVLELGRIDAGQLSLELGPVELAPLLADVLALMRPLAEARQVALLAVQGDGAAGAVRADPVRLKQVLLNLVGNAIKYNRNGGEVGVGWAWVADGVRLHVRDTGPGIALSDQARLFEPFERLGAERSGVEGTGIGLAVCRRLVLAMAGEVGLDSEPGRGSTFWLRLPRA